MKLCTQTKLWLIGVVIILGLAAPAVVADDRDQTTPSPGYRPDNENAAAFIESLDSATVAVFPALVRREHRTAHSFSSRGQAVSRLNAGGIFKAKLANKRLDLGDLQRASQWELFQYGLETVTRGLADYTADADYLMVIEFLVPDGQTVFGIEFYILDREGRDVFSFLLNSHHEMFAEAKLQARNSSEEAREDMLLAATDVAVAALERQITEAKPGN